MDMVALLNTFVKEIINIATKILGRLHEPLRELRIRVVALHSSATGIVLALVVASHSIAMPVGISLAGWDVTGICVLIKSLRISQISVGNRNRRCGPVWRHPPP